MLRVRAKAVNFFVCILLMIACSGCANQSFDIKQLAKTDIDMVTDIVLGDMQQELIILLKKLYKRNPDQLARVSGMTIQKRVAMVFQKSGRLQFHELSELEEIAAMNLAFSQEFKGDRVFALIVGLTTMLRQSYNYENDFYIYDELDAQSLYNSARNVEVMAWKLKNNKTSAGKPYLVTSTYEGVIDNMSFERLYGKLIQTQDIMAKIIADRDNRTVNTVIKGTLSVFLPI